MLQAQTRVNGSFHPDLIGVSSMAIKEILSQGNERKSRACKMMVRGE